MYSHSLLGRKMLKLMQTELRKGGFFRRGAKEVRILFGTGSWKKRERTNDFYSCVTRLV
jgi:hypothetical protein